MFFSPTDFHRFHGFGYTLCMPICGISGKYLSSHGFHGFSQIWLHVIRAHLWHQWEMFFSPTDFTDFHRFGYMLSVFICGISGNIFSPTDFTDFHGFGYMLSVFICDISGKCSFLPRISLICTDLIINYPWVLYLWVK